MEQPVLLSIVIEPKSEADHGRLRRGLAALISDDAAFRAAPDRNTGAVVLGASTEQQLETILDRLHREFGVEAHIGVPQVAYKETLTQRANGEMKYARQVAGRGEYGHVKLEVAPGAPGSGAVVEDEIAGGAIPSQFIASVTQGIRDALSDGVLAGYPVDDVRILVHDGSYHDVDSSNIAFRIAGAMAFQDAAKRAGPVLLEPVMHVEVVVLEEHVDDVKENLASRRGELLTQEGRSGMQVVTARVPLADMFGYSTDLRERTRGRGTFTMHFARYQPCRLSDEGGERDSFVGAPRKRPPTRKDARIALPEPDSDASGF